MDDGRTVASSEGTRRLSRDLSDYGRHPRRMKYDASIRFFCVWAALLVAGVILLLYGHGAWPALGMLIVAPTLLTALFMGWGWLVIKVIGAFGGDPTDGWVGVSIFISFALLLLPLLIALFWRR